MIGEQVAQTQQAIRKHYLLKRQALDMALCLLFSQKIQEKIIKSDYWKKAVQIAFFLPIKNEVDLQALISHADAQYKTFYLPIVEEKTKTLFFAEYFPGRNSLEKNKYGILEPKNTPLIAADKLDLVCVPLLVFDPQCHRIGMGGGYYDRTFAFTKTQLKKPPYLLGIAYELQRHDVIIPAAWDVQLDAVVTEARVYTRDTANCNV